MSETGHWGAVDEDLLYDVRRYEAYARAHHVAGHYWALVGLEEPCGPAGLALGLPRALDAVTAAEVEASAVLVEALGVEWIRDLWRLADFGLTPADVDWDEVRRRLGDVAALARDRGCRRHSKGAGRLLADEGWLHETAWHALRDWDEIARLADRVGRGQVLEPDEVGEVLRWW